jgi:RNA polymerase sigma-70 factor (ECF subfamily)
VDGSRREAEARFRALFEQSSRPLLAYALRRVREPADASDVVAETFVVAWRRLDEVPRGDHARYWLFGVARRQLANQQRGDVRRSNLADRLGGQLGAQVVLDQTGPAELRHIVETAMARIDPDDRELLRLASWEGLGPSEVAVVMSITAATARTRLHRARSRLRVQMEALGWQGRSDDPNRAGRPGAEEAGEQPLVEDLDVEGLR